MPRNNRDKRLYSQVPKTERTCRHTLVHINWLGSMKSTYENITNHEINHLPRDPSSSRKAIFPYLRTHRNIQPGTRPILLETTPSTKTLVLSALSMPALPWGNNREKHISLNTIS